MRRCPRLSAIAIGAAIAASTAPVRAEGAPRTSSLGWVRLAGAESCIDARALAQAVEQRLGRAVFVSPAQADVQIEGRIEPAPLGQGLGWPGFRAHLTLTGANGAVLGTRELEALPHEGNVSCRTLDEQLALVIALLIDPDAALGPRPAPAPPAAPRVVVERVFVPVPVTPPPPPRSPWEESLAIGAASGLGLLPGATIALSLRADLTPPKLFPFEIGGAVWLDARAEPPGSSGSTKGAMLALAYGMIGACPLFHRSGGTRLAGCAELGVGAVRSVGYGFNKESGVAAEQPVVNAGLAGRVTQTIVGPLEIGIGLSLVVPLRRARFYYVDAANEERELFRTAPVAGLFDAAVGLAFR
jgi:hypothetical protein